MNVVKFKLRLQKGGDIVISVPRCRITKVIAQEVVKAGKINAPALQCVANDVPILGMVELLKEKYNPRRIWVKETKTKNSEGVDKIWQSV